VTVELIGVHAGSALLAGVSELTLARWQFAITTLVHFIFVPLTLGLAPWLAIMQTKWFRSGDDAWLRLTRFFGTLFLINFAVGVATGLVQEFQFGMNWSSFSAYVGDVFGSPLAIEGLGAFMLEATFIGLWVFGWDRLGRKTHLATVYMVWFGSWLSAYFIIAANSWMQHPVGYQLNTQLNRAQATDISKILFQEFTIAAYIHVILAGLMTGLFVVLAVSCWHLLRRRNVDLFRRTASAAAVIGVLLTLAQLGWGSEFGVYTTKVQPMKIAASEALWNTAEPAPFSLIQIGGFTTSDQSPSFTIEIPGLLSFLATNSFKKPVTGMNQTQSQEQQQYGPGNYLPPVELVYWSMRVMAYGGVLALLIATAGALLVWRHRLQEARWFHRAAIAGLVLPFLSNFAGWVMTETGRQPWIAYGLLRTADGVSPVVSVWQVALSLGSFVVLYLLLIVADIWLMARFARVDPGPAEPSEPEADAGVRAAPAY
jgi:cytochrome d ubiquinol oxidase subunit I